MDLSVPSRRRAWLVGLARACVDTDEAHDGGCRKRVWFVGKRLVLKKMAPSTLFRELVVQLYNPLAARSLVCHLAWTVADGEAWAVQRRVERAYMLPTEADWQMLRAVGVHYDTYGTNNLGITPDGRTVSYDWECQGSEWLHMHGLADGYPSVLVDGPELVGSWREVEPWEPIGVTRITRAALRHYEATGEIRGAKVAEFYRAIMGDLRRRMTRLAKRLGWSVAEAQAAVWAGAIRRAGKQPRGLR